MTSSDKDIIIAQLESKIIGLEKQLSIYRSQLEHYENNECPKCKELEKLVTQLKNQNIELQFALVNPRNAGRKKSISDETIYRIGKDKLAGMNARELSEKYNISKTTIYKIINSTETYLEDSYGDTLDKEE